MTRTPALPELSDADFERIAGSITSADSPVGIDAKKTHVLILHLLLDLQQRVRRIEERLGEAAGSS